MPLEPPTVLLNAHSHNDYEHQRPLEDALSLGFTSVEADVYLVDGELLVAHYPFQVDEERTLEGLYLAPLWERFRQHGDTVLPGAKSITLLIDIKRDGVAAYAALQPLLVKYRRMLSVTIDGNFVPGAVTVVISGDRPIQQIRESNPRYVGIDGRFADLNSDEPASLYPLISENWANHFEFRGVGQMNDSERTKLREWVNKAHTNSRRLRFWATADYEKLWTELHAANVDLIGTDDLPLLARFLKQQQLDSPK